MYPSDYRYTREHEWIKLEGTIGIVGITDYAQRALGDIVYVQLPQLGTKLEASQSFGSVESVKAASDLYCPVAGEVIEVNEALNRAPGMINQDPHGAAWIIKIRVADPSQVQGLMDADAYQAYVAEKEQEAGH
ncbi:MAG: glycine cleavage system protein GcvH [Firmicutes bacterium]|nr:glycine cleavage system protein GcvH [Bacillota bacterium]